MLIILKSDYGNNVSHKKSDNDYYGDNDNAVNFLGIFISTNFFFSDSFLAFYFLNILKAFGV